MNHNNKSALIVVLRRTSCSWNREMKNNTVDSRVSVCCRSDIEYCSVRSNTVVARKPRSAKQRCGPGATEQLFSALAEHPLYSRIANPGQYSFVISFARRLGLTLSAVVRICLKLQIMLNIYATLQRASDSLIYSRARQDTARGTRR